MAKTGGFNTHRETDFHTNLDDVETVEVTDGGHITQIRNNIANMLWKNLKMNLFSDCNLFVHYNM